LVTSAPLGRVDIVAPLLLARVATLAGSALLVAATFVPVNGGGTSGYRYAIFDRSIQRELILFALEPLGVAVLATLTAVFLVTRAPRLAAGVLLAFGLQSMLLFLAYFGMAAFGNPDYNSLRPGAVVGLAGAAALLAGGSLVVSRDRDADRARHGTYDEPTQARRRLDQPG
jgi:hypothetical protein